MNGVRPERVSRPWLVLACLALAFFGIARTTGSGWVTVVLCVVLACLLYGMAWPAVAVCRVTLRVSTPRDATVDRSLVVRADVTAGSGLRMRLLDPPGDWVSVHGRVGGELVVCPARRGVFESVDVQVASAAPLGLFWWRRALSVALDAPLEVGPRRLAPSHDELPWSGAAGQADEARGHTGQDMVRSIRAYLPGDAARLVHWPATARWGDLMVREMEAPELPRLAIVVDLRHGGGRAEGAASRAAGLAEAALGQGLAVWLVTAERGGGVTGEVASARQVGRRLARAVAAAPPEGPLPEGSLVVRVDH